MSANRTLTVCAQVAIAALLSLSGLLALPVQAAPYVSTEQQTQIVADYGAAAPFGSWSKMREVQTFYLHNSKASQVPEDPTVTGSGDTWYDTNRPPATGTPDNAQHQMQLGGAPLDPKPMYVPGSGGNFGTSPYSCLGGDPPTANSQVPYFLDDTAIFRVKANFYGTTSNVEGNYLLVDFVDVDPTATTGGVLSCQGSTASCAQGSEKVLPVVSGCRFATVRANIDRGSASGLALAAGTYLFQSQWLDVCAPLGGNPVSPGCSPLYGYTIPKGHAIGLIVHAQSEAIGGADAGNVVLQYDSRRVPSNFQIDADSARVNQWAQDRVNTPTNNFPSGTQNGVQTNSVDRTMHWRAVQFSTWGHNCGIQPADPVSRVNFNHNDCLDPAPSTGTTRVWDGIEEFGTFWRVRDMNPSHTGAGYCRFQGDFCYNQFLSMDETLGLVDTDPSQDALKLRCCNALNRPIVATDPTAGDGVRGLQRYSYAFTYPPTFKDGEYRVEFQDEGRGWNAPYTFFIGGSGFDFKFHADEPRVDSTRTIADHLVALGESTKYTMLLTNDGATTDTYAISVPAPGSGWQALVSPSGGSITLPPKGTASIDVTIVPPETARAGDIKVVPVAAASPSTNAVKTLYTRTTYTALETHQVFLTTPVPFIELRPGLTKLAPIIVHNNGTVADSYIMTTSGMPAGWVTKMTPAFVSVLAASREDTSVSIRADPGAPPGESFALKVTACLTEDNSVCGSVDIPVKVFEVHGVAVETLPPTDLRCTTTQALSLAQQTPGIGATTGPHLTPCSRIIMRDAEQDYHRYSGNEQCFATEPVGGVSAVGPCAPIANRDTKFDDSAIFRLKVTNQGDTQDSIEFTGAWDPPVYHPGVEDCTTAPDGVPDGWRFRVLGGDDLVVSGTTGNPFTPSASGGRKATDPGMIYPTPELQAPANIDFYVAELGTAGNTANPQYGVGRVTGFSGDYRIMQITLAPHTAQYVYFELFWMDSPEVCAAQPSYCEFAFCFGQTNFRSTMPSPDAYFRASWRSLTESSFRGNQLLHAHLADGDGAGQTVPEDPGDSRTTTVNSNGDDPIETGSNPPTQETARHTVLLERGIGQPDEELAPIGTATPYATFNMVATNTGNEYDNLKIDVDNGHNGWRHSILATPFDLAGTGIIASGAAVLQPTPPNMPPCAATPEPMCQDRPNRGEGATSQLGCPFTDGAIQQHVICKGMGVYDSVNFQARCTPPAWARPGDYDDMAITVTSDRATLIGGVNVFSRQTVRCIAQGEYSFNAENPNHDLTCYKTQTIAFPVSIHNTGLSNDRYAILVDAHVNPDGTNADLKTDAWNAQTSAGAIVAVPSGYRWHGFMSVTCPADAEITAEGPVMPGAIVRQDDDPLPDHHFRLLLQSLDGPGQESKVLDFTAIVVEDPPFTVSADPVTIGSTQSDRIRIKATDCEPGLSGAACSSSGLTSVEFNGHYISVPRNLPVLPRGFSFTCLQGDSDGDGYSDHQEVVATQPPPGNEGLAPQAWSMAQTKPRAPIEQFTPHPNFDKFRGCYTRPEPIPNEALPGPAPSCYPDTTTPASYPPCGAHEYHVTPTFTASRDAIQQLEVSVPEDQLGTSRIAARIQANAVKDPACAATDTKCRFVTFTDAIINMRSVYGISLNVTDGPGDCGHGCKVVPPGRNALGIGPTGILYDVQVINTGLSPQSVALSYTEPQTKGWQVFLDQQQVEVHPPGYQYPDCDPIRAPNCIDVCAGEPDCYAVDPQDRQTVQVGIVAPDDARPGDTATFLVFATVQEDPTQVAQLTLTAKIGEYGVSVDVSPSTYYVAPDEPARFLVTITNTGNVKANFDVSATMPAVYMEPEATRSPCSSTYTGEKFRPCFVSSPECDYDSTIQNVLKPDPYTCYIDALDVNETRHVILEVKAPSSIQPTGSNDPYKVSIDVRNKLSPNTGRDEVGIKVLSFASADVDNDGAREFAVDGCTKSQADGCVPDPTDGYETFREAASIGGTVSREAPLTQYLEAEVRAEFSAAGKMRGESYFIDANTDGHADHFVDVDGDTLPDVLWVPDKGGDLSLPQLARLNFTRDVTGDTLPELFIDLNEGRWSLVFDMAKGVFYPLLQAFIDDDQVIDYIVDLDRDGSVDPGETVLLGGLGGRIKGVIFEKDINGDGVLDKAFDLETDDGSGIPEYFIDGTCDPKLKACSSFRITPQDVTGDGRPDWTYDHTGKDGTPDSFFDPNCDEDAEDGVQCSGSIDTKAQFLRDLGRYWFILLLFGIALVLFVALLVVTRRR